MFSELWEHHFIIYKKQEFRKLCVETYGFAIPKTVVFTLWASMTDISSQSVLIVYFFTTPPHLPPRKAGLLQHAHQLRWKDWLSPQISCFRFYVQCTRRYYSCVILWQMLFKYYSSDWSAGPKMSFKKLWKTPGLLPFLHCRDWKLMNCDILMSSVWVIYKVTYQSSLSLAEIERALDRCLLFNVYFLQYSGRHLQ